MLRRRATPRATGGIRQLFTVPENIRMAQYGHEIYGQFAIQPGPMMAAFDIFEIEIKGRGAHAAMPHLAVDPIAAAAQVVNGLQTIVSRNTHPLIWGIGVKRKFSASRTAFLRKL